MAIVSPAFGQTSEAVESSDSVSTETEDVSQEIIVTATKRAESVQDVPLSISVVTADEISKRGLVSAEDYLRGIPGVNQTTDPVGSSIIIRGLETSPSFQNYSSGTTVATYFGETPITNSGGLAANTNVDIKLVDIERVEVLRGPQGTAFGNSSLGGAVRQIPVAPKLGRLEGHVGAGYSRTGGYGSDNYMIQGTINVPIINDIVSVRASAYHFSDSGIYRKNATTDPTIQEAAAFYGAEGAVSDDTNVGSSKFTGGRIAVLIRPTDDLSLTLSYLSQKTELNGNALANSGRFEQAIFDVAPSHAIRGQRGGASDMKIDLFNATLEYSLGWGSLLATYSHIDSWALNSSSFSQSQPIWPLSYIQDGKHEEDSGEIRFASDLGGRFNFLVGVYAEKVKDNAIFDYRYLGTRADTALFSQEFAGDFLDNRRLTQKAAFGELSYEIVDGLTATVGGRYYDYSRTVSEMTSGEFFGDSSDTRETKSNGSTFRGNLSWKPGPNTLLYASWSEGFRLGKPEAGLPSGVCDVNNDGIVDGSTITIESTRSLESDKVRNYELGTKFSLFQKRLTASAAVFLMDWDGVPFRTAAPDAPEGCGLTYNANAGKARTKGAEFQASLAITDALRADFGASYIDAKLAQDAPALGAFDGDRLPGSPKVNANLSLQYDFMVAGRDVFIRADSIYVGSFYGDVYQSPATKAGDYVKIDLSGRIMFGRVGLDIYVQNLMNEDSYTFRGTSDAGREFFGFRMRPRTVGARLNYNF
ncbi:TonB-dependent receptor [Sphingosinicella sp. GR2756]|uniref:TonB-dependent receptor n=2 Tax=Sphingosinicella rhizophila TaxID=3050082 RepID=A0ABU3Q704_9SPHN|nr:TonB-dependent receptor [Sphingosinicella sp. GR2756]